MAADTRQFPSLGGGAARRSDGYFNEFRATEAASHPLLTRFAGG